MNIAVILLAAAFLVIAVLLVYELHKLKDINGNEEKPVRTEIPETKVSKTEPTAETLEMEEKNRQNIQKIENSLFDDETASASDAHQTSLPREFDELLEQEKKTAEEKKQENEVMFPNAHAHVEPGLSGNPVNISAVDQVVNQMMDDIMKSLELNPDNTAATENLPESSAEDEDVTPLRQLAKVSMQMESYQNPAEPALNLDLLSQIEEVNRAAAEEDNEAAETQEPVTVQQIQQMIEEKVQQDPALEETEELHVIPADADLMEQIEAVNQAAETGEEIDEPEEFPVFAESFAEEEKIDETKETEEEKEGLPLKMIGMKNSIFGQWKGKCGGKEPVLFIFRSKSYYNVFLDTVRRMYEKELYPAYPFYVCFCENRNKEDRAVDDVSSWFFENHVEVEKILCDTADRYPIQDGTCCYGVGTGTLLDLQFGEMSELGKAEIASTVGKAERNGVRCAVQESSLRMLCADNDSAEKVLGELEEIGEHYGFSVRITAQQNASDICSTSGAFARLIASAIKCTFRGRKTKAVVMPATEWNGNLRGYEAIWFAPAANRAVSFYLNLLCLG